MSISIHQQPWNNHFYRHRQLHTFDDTRKSMYVLASQIAQGKRVLDINCDIGTGSHFLSMTASQVYGMDHSQNAIAYAQKTWRSPQTQFAIGSSDSIPLEDCAVDCIVYFLTANDFALFAPTLVEFQRVLSPDGVVVMAVEDDLIVSTDTDASHTSRFTPDILLHQLAQAFAVVSIWGLDVHTVDRPLPTPIDEVKMPVEVTFIDCTQTIANIPPAMPRIIVAGNVPLPHFAATCVLPELLDEQATGEDFEQNDTAADTRGVITTLAAGRTAERTRISVAEYYRLQKEVEYLRKELCAIRVASHQLANTLTRSPSGKQPAKTLPQGKSLDHADMFLTNTRPIAGFQPIQNEIATLLQYAEQTMITMQHELEKQKMLAQRLLDAIEQQIFTARDDITRIAAMLIASRSWRLGNSFGDVFAVFRPGVPYDATYEIKKDIGALRAFPHMISQDPQKWIHDCITLFSSLQFHIEEITRSKRFLFGRFIMRLFSRFFLRKMLPGAETALSPLLTTTLHQLYMVQTSFKSRFAQSPNGIVAQPVRIVSPISHVKSVDIVICVHNALEAVQECLNSVILHTGKPYNLIIVDDGSQSETQQYLKEFTLRHHARLLRNAAARGYTFAANTGLRASSANYVVMLNSDTVVTPNWLDRLVQCGESSEHIGIIGPLSNTASWQSVPHIEHQGDWAENHLPDDLPVEAMGRLVAVLSPQAYPQISFLNGFCYMIKREVIDTIGLFDEEHFGRGYGEENDYSIRARENNFLLAVADDVYVHHHQSQSYSHDKRKLLADKAMEQLLRLHTKASIDAGVQQCQEDLSMLSIRLRVQEGLTWYPRIRATAERFAGKRIAFLLPVESPGGGANVVLQEAYAIRELLGIDVVLINLVRYQAGFQRAYPNQPIPVTWIDIPKRLETVSADFDAVIATAHHSVEWLAFLPKHVVKGYYVQDFEPYFYPKKSKEYTDALRSYTRFPDLKLITKSQWNHDEVLQQTGKSATIVGPSVDTRLFAPRPADVRWPQRPLNILAMIRPGSAYRNPEMTLRVLQAMREKHGASIELTIFGCTADNAQLSSCVYAQGWNIAGILTREEIAGILPHMDIFVDFSTHQAMGLTALEAMSCGVASIVPQIGGAIEFAFDHINALVVDTLSEQECTRTLDMLILDHELRAKLRRQALTDAVAYSPIGPSIAILDALLGMQ